MKLHLERGMGGAPVRARTSSGLLAPRILSLTPTSARVALVATGALLLAGDHVQIDIVVADGVSLELVEVAATVAYAGRGAECSWSADVAVGEGASMIWKGEPFVVATDARAVRTTRARVADGGSLVVRDTLVLGRHGEAGGHLVSRTDVTHAERPALVEEFHLSADDDRPGIRGGHRVVDQVTAIGCAATHSAGTPTTVASDSVTRLDLLAAGHVDRWLGHDVHRSPLGRDKRGEGGSEREPRLSGAAARAGVDAPGVGSHLVRRLES